MAVVMDEESLPVVFEIHAVAERAQLESFYENNELVLLDYAKSFEINQEAVLVDHVIDFIQCQPELNIDTTVIH